MGTEVYAIYNSRTDHYIRHGWQHGPQYLWGDEFKVIDLFNGVLVISVVEMEWFLEGSGKAGNFTDLIEGRSMMHLTPVFRLITDVPIDRANTWFIPIVDDIPNHLGAIPW